MPKLEEDDFSDGAGNNLPQIKQSSYNGPVPQTNYNSFGSGGNSSYGSGNSFGSSGMQQTSSFGATTNINQSNNSGPVLTGAAPSNAASGADVLVKHDKESQDWINKKWRPVMGWIYMLTCTADFVIFPILWSLLQAMSKGQVTNQWQPLTLQGAGLYHIAMGAVLGIAAYGRTKEKIEGATGK